MSHICNPDRASVADIRVGRHSRLRTFDFLENENIARLEVWIGAEERGFRGARGEAAIHVAPSVELQLVVLRIKERVVLDQLALLPHQPVELADVVRAEAREEHKLLRRRDGRDRVHLQEPELAHGVEHTGRAAVEKLCAYGDAPGAFERELYAGIRTDTTRSSARAR